MYEEDEVKPKLSKKNVSLSDLTNTSRETNLHKKKYQVIIDSLGRFFTVFGVKKKTFNEAK